MNTYKVKLEFDNIKAESEGGARLLFWEECYWCEGALSVLDVEEVKDE